MFGRRKEKPKKSVKTGKKTKPAKSSSAKTNKTTVKVAPKKQFEENCKSKKDKKVLQKNEIRVDLNPAHYNKYGAPHDAVITAKKGHKYRANTYTHADFVGGVPTYDLEKKSNKPKNKRTKISPPFWQNEKRFSKEKKGKIPKEHKSKISRYNRKFKKKT